MPTYEYACKSCGKHLEVVQSFTDDALTTCPTCSGTLRKVFGNIGISFKGTGFYKNDSRSSTRSGSVGAGSDGSSGGAASGDSGSSGDSSAPAKDGGSKESSPAKDTAPAKGSGPKPASTPSSSAAAS